MRCTPVTFLLLILTSFIFPGPLFSQHFNLNDSLPLDKGVTIGHLPNGLTFYVSDNGKVVANMQLRLVVNAGSILEDPDQLGLAHVAEHMNFNGLKHFPNGELTRYLRESGLQLGADLNANTGFEATNYVLWLATDDKKKIDKAFTILEDWDHNALLGLHEINKERKIVLEESRKDKDAIARMHRIYFPVLLNGSRYASRLPVGKDSIIANFAPESLRRFYRTWYRPDLSAVIVVGHIDPFFIQSEIEKHFSDYKNPLNEVPRPHDFTVMPREKDTAMVISDRECPATVLFMYNGLRKEEPLITWADYRAKLLSDMVCRMISERFKSVANSGNPPFIDASADNAEVVPGFTGFSIGITTGDGPLEKVINAISGITGSISKFGFNAPEFQREKNTVGREVSQEFENRNQVGASSFADQYANDFINGSTPISIEDRYRFITDVLPGISLEEINKAALSLLSDRKRFILLLTGEQAKNKIPKSRELLAMVSSAENLPALAYEEKSVAAYLMENDPAPGTLLNESTDENLGTIFLTFNNGVTVTLKPTPFKTGDIQMDAWRFGGSRNYPLSDRESAENAGRLVQFMGVKDFSKADLDKYLAGKSVSVQPYINLYEDGIQGKCRLPDIKEFLQLIHLYFTTPHKDEGLFRTFVESQKAQYGNMDVNPVAFAADSLEKFRYNNSPWASTFPKTSDFDKIRLDRVMDIYHEIFSNARDMHFTIVGDFDPKVILPLLERYLGSLPSGPRENKFTDEGLRPVKKMIDLTIRRGIENIAFVNVSFNGEAVCNPLERLKLEMLTEILNIKIFEKLRTEMGGVYSATAESVFQKRPYHHFDINIGFPCAPENAEKLSKALIDIIADIRTNGIAKKYIDQVRQSLMERHSAQLNTNEYWLGVLSGAWIDQDDPTFISTYFIDIQRIGKHDIEEAALKYLDLKQYTRLIVKP